MIIDEIVAGYLIKSCDLEQKRKIMEKDYRKSKPIMGFDEPFDSGVIVDRTGVELEEVDAIMKVYFRKNTETHS